MLHTGTNHHYDWRAAEHFIDEFLQQHPSVHLVVSGGEPTVSPFLPDLLRKFRGPQHFVGVSSNGVRRPEYWQGLDVEYLGLSYHPEYRDSGWIDRAQAAAQYVEQLTVNLMMDPLHWDHCLDVYQQVIMTTDLDITPVRIVDWDSGETPCYTQQQNQWLFDNGPRRSSLGGQQVQPQHRLKISGQWHPAGATWADDLVARRENRFLGWECDIGLDSTFVQFDGSYRRGNCEQGGYLGWIRAGYQQPNAPVICGYNECQCLTDISIPKRRQSGPVWRIKPIT